VSFHKLDVRIPVRDGCANVARADIFTRADERIIRNSMWGVTRNGGPRREGRTRSISQPPPDVLGGTFRVVLDIEPTGCLADDQDAFVFRLGRTQRAANSAERYRSTGLGLEFIGRLALARKENVAFDHLRIRELSRQQFMRTP
jgi:hypothetical protein